MTYTYNNVNVNVYTVHKQTNAHTHTYTHRTLPHDATAPPAAPAPGFAREESAEDRPLSVRSAAVLRALRGCGQH